MHWLSQRRPSAALVLSTLSLIIALGGTSYAAFSLPKNSVGTRQLRNRAVTGAKIAPGAITGSAIAKGTITGANINAGTLGTVPWASNANHANSANTANTANSANTANTANSANTANTAVTATTAGGAPPTGSAGGALTGSYPNPGLAGPEAVHLVGAPGEPAFDGTCTNDPGFEPAGFYKDRFGIVHLQGDIYQCTTTGFAAFTLPVGYRPASTLRFLIEDGNTDGATGVLKIDPDGDVSNYVTKAPVINGITFRAGS